MCFVVFCDFVHGEQKHNTNLFKTYVPGHRVIFSPRWGAAASTSAAWTRPNACPRRTMTSPCSLGSVREERKPCFMRQMCVNGKRQRGGGRGTLLSIGESSDTTMGGGVVSYCPSGGSARSTIEARSPAKAGVGRECCTIYTPPSSLSVGFDDQTGVTPQREQEVFLCVVRRVRVTRGEDEWTTCVLPSLQWR